MLINYLKIAFRNLLKHRFFSLLNITGLALGMASCLTAILILKDQLGYDNFQPDRDRVYRIICQNKDGMKLASVAYPLGDAIDNNFSQAQNTVRLVRSIYAADATTEDKKTLQVNGYFTEPSFFEVFGFTLESGNPGSALAQPNTMVISEDLATRLYPGKNPVGQTLTLNGKGNFQITGIVASPPGKSHLRFDVLASAATLVALDRALPPAEAGEKILDNWSNRYMSYVYVRVNPGTTQRDLNKALDQIAHKRFEANMEDKDVSFFAQSLNNITPAPERLANDTTDGAPWFFMYGIGFIVLLLILFPALNYANLATAQALSRTKEIGIRKTVGAKKADVRKLILTESVLTALIALLLASQFSIPLNHFVARYFPVAMNFEGLKADTFDWAIFILFGAVVGLIAGWLPANRLARMGSLAALKQTTRFVGRSPFRWRSIMLVGQFAVSLIFLVFVVAIWVQMKFMLITDYGFQKENLVTVPLQGNDPAILKNELSQDPHVVGITQSSLFLASSNLQGMPVKLEAGGAYREVHSSLVDPDFMQVMGLKLVAGQDFPRQSGGRQKFLIFNQKAVSAFNWGTPADAVGKTVWLDDTTTAVVCGIAEDFHYRNLESGIDPFALQLQDSKFGTLYLRISPGDPVDAMQSLRSIWKKVDAVHPFEGAFMEENIRQAYNHVTFVGGLMSFFTLLALVLASMGLLGMVTFTVNNKIKEIGIRKVLGASITHLTFQLSRQFLILLGFALIVALPVSYILVSNFLNVFVYHITLGFLILGGSSVLMILLALITIGIQTLRAALANPVETLMHE